MGFRLVAAVGRQQVLGALSSLLVILLCATAKAENEPSWLTWSAPPECPTASDIGRRVTELYGGALPRNRHLAVATRLSWTGAQWFIAVDVTLDEQRGERRVTVDSCAQAADFVAVAVVLALDPTSSSRPVPAGDRASERPQHDPEPKPGPERSQPAARARTGDTEPHRQRSAATKMRPHVSLVMDGALGELPGPHLGGALWLGLDVGRVGVSLVGAWYPAAATTPDRALAPIDFSLLEGRASLTYWLLGPAVRVGPSLSFHAGVIESDQIGSGSSPVREPWLAVGIGPQCVVAVAGPVSLFAEAELNLPILMPTFVLDDGSEVHRPGIGGRLALGGRISLHE
jgi:hypothetical protein